MSALLRRATAAISRPAAWLGIVLALDAVIAVAGIFLAHGSGLLGLLAAAPLLACARCDGLATAIVAAYAIALCAIAAVVIGTPAGSRRETAQAGASTWAARWPRRWPNRTWTPRSGAWSGS
jgi:hypothetical protein